MKARVLYADPPWAFGDKLPGPKRGAAKHYGVMGDGKGGVEAICRFPLPPLHDDALLFLWRVSSQQEDALRVMRAWGFVPKSEIVWVKGTNEAHLAFGMGRYVRLCHEVCLIGSRGRGVRLIRDRAVRSVRFDAMASFFIAPRGKHSEKPAEMYKIIELLADGPYCELFARRRCAGWMQYGNELPGALAAPLHVA